jgi:terminase small subunit / prophage DNA-packing protein
MVAIAMASTLEHQGKTLVNKKTLCLMLGISTQAFDKWRVSPATTKGRDRFFDIRDVLDNRLENQAKKDNPTSGQVGDGKELAQKRAEEEYLLTLERRKGQQIKNEIAAGEVIPTEFATWAISKLAAQIASILDTLPLTVRRGHPELETRHIDSITKEVAKARNEAAQIGESLPELVEQYADDYSASG